MSYLSWKLLLASFASLSKLKAPGARSSDLPGIRQNWRGAESHNRRRYQPREGAMGTSQSAGLSINNTAVYTTTHSCRVQILTKRAAPSSSSCLCNPHTGARDGLTTSQQILLTSPGTEGAQHLTALAQSMLLPSITTDSQGGHGVSVARATELVLRLRQWKVQLATASISGPRILNYFLENLKLHGPNYRRVCAPPRPCNPFSWEVLLAPFSGHRVKDKVSWTGSRRKSLRTSFCGKW